MHTQNKNQDRTYVLSEQCLHGPFIGKRKPKGFDMNFVVKGVFGDEREHISVYLSHLVNSKIEQEIIEENKLWAFAFLHPLSIVK